MLPDHVAGWILLICSYWLLFTLKSARRNKRIFVCLFMILSVYHVLALANEFYFTVPGTDVDAKRFHEHAVEFAEHGEWEFALSHRLYEQLLGTSYRLFGVSRFFGSEFSILAVFFSCITLLEFARLLGIRRFQISMLLAFALFPGMATRGSTTMREAFEILFLIQGTYWGFRFLINRRRKEALFSTIGLLAAAMVHKALLLYVMFLVGYIFIYLNCKIAMRDPRKRYKRIFQACCVLATVALLVFGVSKSQNLPMGMEVLSSVVSGDAEYATEAVSIKSEIEARTTYSVQVDSSSLPTLLKTSPVGMINYLMAPYPWQVRNAMDAYGALVVLFRLTLLFFAIKAWARCPAGTVRQISGSLLVIFFSLGFLWAMGTTNYGTAERHNLTHFWIIVLLGWPPLMASLSKLLPTTKAMYPNRRRQS